MAFIRTVKRENPFVQLDKTFFEDDNLQWESKGLLGYILSRPDNWKVNQTDLTKRSAGGKGKVESALLDLMANGYVHWYAVRKENGQIEEWVYDVYERPEFNPKKDECIAEGKKRIEAKKAKTKQKNEKKKEKQPELDNPKVDGPESGYPEVGNPDEDNPVYNNNDFKDIDFNNIEEEEEVITIALSDVISFMNNQIDKREITNKKTLTAIFEVAEKCKAIGTNDREVMENYCIKVVEDKMSRFGQKQKAAGSKHKEYIPTHMQQQMEELFDVKQKEGEEKQKVFETLPDEEKQAIQEKKQREIEDMLKQLRA